MLVSVYSTNITESGQSIENRRIPKKSITESNKKMQNHTLSNNSQEKEEQSKKSHCDVSNEDESKFWGVDLKKLEEPLCLQFSILLWNSAISESVVFSDCAMKFIISASNSTSPSPWWEPQLSSLSARFFSFNRKLKFRDFWQLLSGLLDFRAESRAGRIRALMEETRCFEIGIRAWAVSDSIVQAFRRTIGDWLSWRRKREELATKSNE